MKSPTPIVIIGSQGFAREIHWLIEDINRNSSSNKAYDFLGYIDTEKESENSAILGDDSWAMENLSRETRFVIAIGNPAIRKEIAGRYLEEGFTPTTLIHPSARFSESVSFGVGSLVCAGSILSVDISVGAFCIINLNSTVGHGSQLASFVTLSPGVHISGEVSLGSCAELGTGAVVLPGKKVGERIRLGAGAVVTQDLMQAGTYIGIPAKRVTPMD